MKAIWKGSITFGLINIPINVYPASEEHVIEFHMLHNKDLSPIRFARICKTDNQEVPYTDIVKGFEYEKGAYVVIDDEDFKRANVKKTSTITVQYFTDIDQINPIYYEKPYYLEPDKQAGKAYKLLWEALLKSNKIGIGNFVFRNREHIGAILPLKEGLLLMQMRYQSEIRSFEKLELPKEKTSPKELEIAIALIDQLTERFQPQKHHDTYTEELMEIIAEKSKGGKKVRKGIAPPPTYRARDLMSLLQESLKKTLHEANHKKKKTPPQPRAKRKRIPKHI
jgi:DNA end-binding protein Ku